MEIQQKNKVLDLFKKTNTFKYFYSTLLRFDYDLNCFVATEKWRNKEAELLTAAWWMFEEAYASLWLLETKQAAKADAVPAGFILVPKELTHEHAVKISDDPEFFEIYQNIVTDSDTSEDSVSVLLRVAHKVMVKAQEPNDE